MLILLVIFAAHLPARAQVVESLVLNSSIVGTTVGAQRSIFTSFSFFDVREAEIGAGGQKIVAVEISEREGEQTSSEGEDFSIELSTCLGSDFDTYIALLDRNPLVLSDAQVLSESANDLSCSLDRSRAALTTVLSPGIYYVLVTGNGVQEGQFNLSLTGASVTPTPVPWGLDRVDQRALPLDKQYSVQDSGKDVWVYTIDSGIRVSHSEFEDRAEEGYDFVDNRLNSARDCTGHGTHVAGIIAGKNFGVAKKAQLVAVRVFGCDNKAKLSAIVNALEWVLIDSQIRERTNTIIALMFTMNLDEQSLLSRTMAGLIRSGIPVIVPAGNNNGNACNYYPSSLEPILTVGSADENDDRSSFSNYGECVDLYAPGRLVPSSWHTSDTAWRNLSGTAQATAHVVGIVANLVSINSGIKEPKVGNVISSISTVDTVGNVAKNESTRYAFVRSVPKFGGDPPGKRKVFLFTVVNIKAQDCKTDSNELKSIQETLTEVLSINNAQLKVSCSDGPGETKRFHLQIETAERKAAGTFVLLEQAVTTGKREIEELLGFSFTVAELPWAVDSTPTVFWGAPSFSETGSQAWSAGAIAGIASGVFCVVAILAAVSWVIYRRVTKADEVQSMEGSADIERGPVHFDDFANTDASAQGPRSFRNVIRAMSFRRSGSMRGSFVGGEAGGINKMGSFIGGPETRVARDMVRMESFGGEAFAALPSISRSSSMASFNTERTDEDSSDSIGGLSFRGENNTILNYNKTAGEGRSDTSTDLTDESLRMHSLGGEAFAIVSEQLREETEAQPRVPSMRNRLPGDRPEEHNRLRMDLENEENFISRPDREREHSFFSEKNP